MKLQGRSEDDEGRNTVRGEFQSKVCEQMKELRKEDGSVEGKWSVIKLALCESAQSVLGLEGKYHSDWFRENKAT